MNALPSSNDLLFRLHVHAHCSLLRQFRLDDGRPSDVHAHAYCLRSEQCACTCNLNNKSLLEGSAFTCDQLLAQTNNRKALS